MSDETAYLLTISAYGERLHGDERGSVSRGDTQDGALKLGWNPALEAWERNAMQSARMRFGAPERSAIEDAVKGVCDFRGWFLHAVHCRTNHLHAVVGADTRGEVVAHDLKAYATRALRRGKLVEADQPVWTRGFSCRLLRGERAIAEGIRYVVSRQGQTWRGRSSSASALSGTIEGLSAGISVEGTTLAMTGQPHLSIHAGHDWPASPGVGGSLRDTFLHLYPGRRNVLLAGQEEVPNRHRQLSPLPAFNASTRTLPDPFPGTPRRTPSTGHTLYAYGSPLGRNRNPRTHPEQRRSR